MIDPAILIGILSLIIGIIVIGANIQKSYFSNYVETVGTIIDFDKRYDYMDNSTTYAPIIQYNVDKITYTYTTSSSSSIKPRIGKNITIMYNPNNPNKIIIKNNPTEILVGLLLIFIGITALIANI